MQRKGEIFLARLQRGNKSDVEQEQLLIIMR
jgi:hypothetical protein